MSLKEYVKKRDFKKTAEPKGNRSAGRAGHRFVIQKHAASRLHYDFRLELDGTLKSWAVPKGVPFAKGERRLAVHVEDHPVSYIDFEGTIPKGQYGGGTVMVWDRGTYEPLSETPAKDLAGGKLHFVLSGEKLRGEWYLVQLRGGDEWLLIKGSEDLKPVSAKADDTSVLSGKSMAALSGGEGRVWQSNRAEPTSFKARMAKLAEKTESRKSGKAARSTTNASPRKSATAAAKTAQPKPRGKKTRAGKTVASAADDADGPKGRTTDRSDPRPARRTSATRQLKAAKRTPDFIDPMKAELVETPSKGEWVFEIKFDGFRAMAYRDARGTRLLSRNNKDFAGRFPEVVEAIAELDVADAVIDGEIVALDAKGRSSFQLLQAQDLGEERPPILFYAFDLLQLNGRNFQSEPLTVRKAALEELLKDREGLIRFSVSLGDQNQVDALLKQARGLGLEGLIGKRPDSPYEAGRRSGNWIKLKLLHEQEFIIGGYTPPGGARQHFGALLVGVYDGDKLRFAGKVGTGFNAKVLRALYDEFQKIASAVCPFADLPERRSGRFGQGITAAEMKRCHWVEPSMVCQIRFTEWTRDNHLRHPAFLGLREDKAATEVIREKQS